jgi:hypothetical protein
VGSFDEIKDAFNNAYDESFSRICSYNENKLKNDIVMKYMLENNLYEKFHAEKSVIIRNKMYDSVILCFKPELQSNYKCLDNEDLSINRVFAYSNKEIPQEFEDMLYQSEGKSDEYNMLM